MTLCLLTACVQEEFTGSCPELYGSWEGSGRLYNVKTNDLIGRIPFSIAVHPDNSVSGDLGDSQLMDARIEEWRYGYRAKGTLKGEVKNGVKLDKNCLFILLSSIDEEKIDGDFHIKSNFVFDFSMEVGGFTLTRSLSETHEGAGPVTQSHGDGNSRENSPH
jgi:hypothetical protein